MARPLLTTRTYSELILLKTFKERFAYLKLSGTVGLETFALDRALNQVFYKSKAWKDVRDFVIVRDRARDLAMPGYDLEKGIVVHHMNPVTLEEVERRSSRILEPEYLICVSDNTHHAIHFSNEERLVTLPAERYPGDTTPWKERKPYG